MKAKIFIFTLLLIFSSILVFSACNNDGNTYVVKLDSDGGNINELYELAPNDKVTKPETPVKPGYTFIDWYYGDKVWDFDTDIVSTNMEIIAKWTLNTYTARFYIDGALEHTQTFTVEDGTTLVGPEIASKDGYTHKWDDLTIKPQDMEINAVYTLIKYKITYTNLQDSAIPTLISFTYNDFNAQDEIELQPLINEALAEQGIAFLEWQDKHGNTITKITKSDLNNLLKEETSGGEKTTFSEIILKAVWSSGKTLLTLKEYNALESWQKREYRKSFPTPEAFEKWLDEAKAKYAAEQDSVMTEGDVEV